MALVFTLWSRTADSLSPEAHSPKRDPMPTVAVWDTLLPETKNKHKVYRVLVERKDSFIKAVGLRCVIPLE